MQSFPELGMDGFMARLRVKGFPRQDAAREELLAHDMPDARTQDGIFGQRQIDAESPSDGWLVAGMTFYVKKKRAGLRPAPMRAHPNPGASA